MQLNGSRWMTRVGWFLWFCSFQDLRCSVSGTPPARHKRSSFIDCSQKSKLEGIQSLQLGGVSAVPGTGESAMPASWGEFSAEMCAFERQTVLGLQWVHLGTEVYNSALKKATYDRFSVIICAVAHCPL